MSLGPLRPALCLHAAGMLVAAGVASAQTDLAGDDIDRIARAVVRVVALQGGEDVSSGSGTVVDGRGVIFTNRHVIEVGEDYRVEVLENLNDLPVPRYHARLLGYSLDVDFAVLQIDRDDRGQPIAADRLALPFIQAMAEDARRGDEVFVFGYPGIGDGYLTFTEGIVTSIRDGTIDDQRLAVWYQTDAQISPGNSGGLAVNARGEMVGIPTSVRTEERTGGRLGGVLPVNALLAALNRGLETDVSRIAAATAAPVIEGGTLDFDQAPTFGSAEFADDFTGDPYTVEMVSGGEVATGYLGVACTGYAAVAPDFRMHWHRSSQEFRIFFASDAGGDTTLLVNLPDGSWVCNDDAGGTLDPMIVIGDPPQGQYDVWVGSLEAGAFVPGALYVTELNLDPTAVAPTELDFQADPHFDWAVLRAGFAPNPNVSMVSGGGSVDVSYLGGECVGYAAQAPDVRLTWEGGSDELRIFFFAADAGEDASLLVNLPDGTWVCNDDASSLDPLIILENPMEGQYDIWVGSHQRGRFISGGLVIEEQRPEP